MTSFRIFLFCLIFTAFSAKTHAQELLHIRNGCHFDGDDTERELYGYAPSDEAQEIIGRITAVMGLDQNFTIKSANVANALATTEGRNRYVLYSTTFLENFKRDAQTQWAAYCVLAHEIGHHLNNHDFAENDPKRRKLMELAADRFAGNILQKMGASLEQAQAGINSFSLTGESNTHPPKSARLEAVANGWKQAKEGVNFKVETVVVDNEKLAKEWYEKGRSESDMNKKIEYYSNAVRFKPDYSSAFYNRGNAKFNLGKYAEAIADYDQVISLKPDNADAFYGRGLSEVNLGKYTEAITDYDEAIRLKPKYALVFINRGTTKQELGKHSEAIADFDEVIRLSPTYPVSYANKGCSLVALGKYGAAIDSIREAEKLDASLKTKDWVQKCKQEALSKLKD